ncbi:MAG: Na+/H+ antiporter NhaA [Deferribacterales bacterium]
MTINTIKSFTVDPFNQFLKKQSSSSIIMLGAMVLAMIIANSAYAGWYEALWKMEVGFTFGILSLFKPFIYWINDGLMAIFFLMIGLEIKREVLIGELSSMRKALLPIIAALGGAIVPALIYTVINMKNGNLSGWGVPMATDIAFAIGIMAMLGDRVPIQLKIFLTSLAVVDDIIAVVVIALFYTNSIAMSYLMYAGVVIVILAIMNIANVKSILVYLIVGLILWYFFLKSGVHATVAGVILAFFIPSQPRIPLMTFNKSIGIFMTELKHCTNNPDSEIPTKCQKHIFNKIIHASLSAYNPMSRLEYNLHGISAFLIMPIFAFANTGLILSGDAFSGVGSPISLGIIFGLILGKPVGIMLFVLVAEKIKMITIPEEINRSRLLGAAILSGIGLTMSIFISGMAFSPEDAQTAKLGILIASLVAGTTGFLFLKAKG